MSVTWNCEDRRVIDAGDDSPFILAAMRELLLTPEGQQPYLKFSELGTQSQRWVLARAQELKKEYGK
jgi:hypothetical protein